MDKKLRYQRHNREYWLGHIDAWKESDMSQSEYCRQNNIPLSSFGNWKAKFTKSNPNESAFVELPGEVLTVSKSDYFEIILNDGLVLRIREDIPTSFLRNILHTMRGI